MADRKFSYILLDVFTRNRLEGNQLAVFTDGRDLSDAEMQALARETKLSETTFVIPRDIATERERGVQVRIFTVSEELQFAGHPTLGTAFALHGGARRSENAGESMRTRSYQQTIYLDLKVGKIPVEFSVKEDYRLFGEMTQRDPEFGSVHDKEAVAQATGLALEDLDPKVPVQTVSTGLAFAIVPVRSLAAIRKISLQYAKVQAYLDKTDARFFYFVTQETETKGSTMHARMLFYNGEDPATGSAAGCCASWAVQHGVLPSGEQGCIEQGLEMLRPSYLYVRGNKNGSGVSGVRVGGHVVEVARGVVSL
jgi:trans-2,3-dihydro-3-hydroxyanthranilate isomerase